MVVFEGSSFREDERYILWYKCVCVFRCLCVEGRSGVGALLTKYARVSSQKGVKLYSSRK